MKVLFIYRHPDMGFSIGKVFYPIEQEMKKYCKVDALYLPMPNYKLKSIYKNIRCTQNAVKKVHYDIIHITGTEHYLLPFLKGQKKVVTVHDLGFFTNQPFSLRSVWKYCFWIKTLKYADRIVFISEKSHAETFFLTQFKEGQDRIIYNAVGKEFTYKKKIINITCPTVLHIGTKPNKNLNNTIVALKDFPHHLRIIGKLDEKQKALLDIYHIKYTNAYKLTNEEIKNEYEQCDIVNFPSLYEGFGMPIIEGQAVGRVVITSNLSPMKEIAGGSAVLVNPDDTYSILSGYKEAILNHTTYIQSGLENTKRFQLEDITKAYHNLYKELNN